MTLHYSDSILRQRLKKRQQENAMRMLRPADFTQIDFSSNDYLGLARSNELLERCGEEWVRINHIKNHRFLGSGGSRLLSGDSDYVHELESLLAEFFQSDATLLFNSGYTANVSLFSALPSRNGTVLYDELIHASVRDGIRMSGCRAWSFRHNDIDHLEELLERAGGEVWVVAESVYSMDGDSPDPIKLVSACEKFNAALIIDEAHSGGVVGPDGSGFCIANGIQDRVYARLFTFGKSFGVHGAAVCGSETLKNYLVNFARPFIYSTALPLHDLATIKTSIGFTATANAQRMQLKEITNYFIQSAQQCGLNEQLIPSTSAIQGLVIPGNENVRRVADICRSKGLDVRPVQSPTVTEGAERLRIILHAYNSRQEVDLLIETVLTAFVDKS